MVKRKLSLTITPNTLEIMIEYMSTSNILNVICEMTKIVVETSKRRYQTKLPLVFAQNQNMGSIMEKGN
jgi:hypothetical protein